MAEPLKDMFSPEFYDRFSDFIAPYLPNFNKKDFVKSIFDKDWNNRELKDRVRHTSTMLKPYFPSDFAEAARMLGPMVEDLKKEKFTKYGFEFMFFPDYIEQFGLDDYEAAVKAMERVTQLVSCEFAVRPFILKYGGIMLAQMLVWSKHPHHHVRRFASEGCRPRLPWAMGLPELKKDPTPILPILENLKNDAYEFVRRSVANNLNDISKDHPEIVLAIFKRWKGKTAATDKIIKHGCRTLLKQGHPEALELFGFGSTKNLRIEDFKLEKDKVKIGEDLNFSFVLRNRANSPQLVRLEYGIYLLKANGSHSRKVFQISEKEVPANSVTTVSRKQSFRIITTRRYYHGEHKISIIVNGKEFGALEFQLTGN